MQDMVNGILSFVYSMIDPKIIFSLLYPLIPFKKWILGIFAVCFLGGLIGNKIVMIKQITFGGLSTLQRLSLLIFGTICLFVFFILPPNLSSIKVKGYFVEDIYPGLNYSSAHVKIENTNSDLLFEKVGTRKFQVDINLKDGSFLFLEYQGITEGNYLISIYCDGKKLCSDNIVIEKDKDIIIDGDRNTGFAFSKGNILIYLENKYVKSGRTCWKDRIQPIQHLSTLSEKNEEILHHLKNSLSANDRSKELAIFTLAIRCEKNSLNELTKIFDSDTENEYRKIQAASSLLKCNTQNANESELYLTDRVNSDILSISRLAASELLFNLGAKSYKIAIKVVEALKSEDEQVKEIYQKKLHRFAEDHLNLGSEPANWGYAQWVKWIENNKAKFKDL